MYSQDQRSVIVNLPGGPKGVAIDDLLPFRLADCRVGQCLAIQAADGMSRTFLLTGRGAEEKGPLLLDMTDGYIDTIWSVTPAEMPAPSCHPAPVPRLLDCIVPGLGLYMLGASGKVLRCLGPIQGYSLSPLE